MSRETTGFEPLASQKSPGTTLSLEGFTVAVVTWP